MTARVGVIGGTGYYKFKTIPTIREEEVKNQYGRVHVLLAEYKGREIAFVPRHGLAHTIPPHKINYRANIRALKDLGAESILATAAVGSLRKMVPPGELVLLSQFIDMTKRRIGTFYDEEGVPFKHLDVTEPFSEPLRERVLRAATAQGIHIHPYGTYVAFEGPRLETAAEISMMQILGGDVVGMTIVPEVVLAGEADLSYAAIAVITNYGVGMVPGGISKDMARSTFAAATDTLERLLLATIDLLLE